MHTMRTAKKIVEDLDAAVREHYQTMAPQHYPGPIAYQRDSRFRPVSDGNLRSYPKLAEDDQFLYTTDPQLTMGFVFSREEIAAVGTRPSAFPPVMTLALRESGIRGLKQAYQLRLRERHARKNVATQWYLAYVLQQGGIVSDTDHLEGGKQLWRSFATKAAQYGVRIFLHDTATGEERLIDANTPEREIWSADAAKRGIVLVLEKSLEEAGAQEK